VPQNAHSQAAVCPLAADVRRPDPGWYVELAQDSVAAIPGVPQLLAEAIASRLQRAGLIRLREGLVTIVDRGKLQVAAWVCHRKLYDNYYKLRWRARTLIGVPTGHASMRKCDRVRSSAGDRALLEANVADRTFELTQECLAEMLGVPRSTLNRYRPRAASRADLRPPGRACGGRSQRVGGGACECYRIVRDQSERLLTRTFG
jgi:hypothetical protein